MDPPRVEKRQDAHQVRGRTPELPDAEALQKKLYVGLYRWIGGHFGRRAAVTFAGLVAFLVGLTLVLHALGELPAIGEDLKLVPGYSFVSELLHNRFHPLPKADRSRFSIALAHLQNDEGRNVEGFIARALRNFADPLDIEFLPFDRTIALKDQSIDSERMGHEEARRYLEESRAQALIWGSVWTSGGKLDAQLYYTTSKESRNSEQAYQPADFKLPDVHRKELTDVLGLVVATQSAEFSIQEGRFIADQLKPFISRVQSLLSVACPPSSRHS